MTHTILCLASYFKGGAFLEECKRQGCHTILVTTEDLQHEDWPAHAIDEFFMMPMPNLSKQPDITHAVSYLARTRAIDRIIALDDYDVETAADLREHLRMPGMGSSRARYFRDKLAMRVQAKEHGLDVPEFVHVLHYDRLRDYMERVPPPWVLKPRSEASSMGIKLIQNADELWPLLDQLGDRQSYFLLEKFLPGDVYHVDSIISEREVVFAQAHKYGLPPMAVYHGGGVFVTSTLPYGGDEEQALQAMNRRLIEALGMVRGVAHAEFIRSQEDGRYHFLEIAARVGGAGTDRLVELAAGPNLWSEWAKLELCHLRGESYQPPDRKQEYGALIVCLARQEWPDFSAYDAPEVAWRLHKKHHVGMALRSPSYERVQQLVREYAPRIGDEFGAVAPPRSSPTG